MKVVQVAAGMGRKMPTYFDSSRGRDCAGLSAEDQERQALNGTTQFTSGTELQVVV